MTDLFAIGLFLTGVGCGGVIVAALLLALFGRSVPDPQPRQDAPDDNANRLEAAARKV